MKFITTSLLIVLTVSVIWNCLQRRDESSSLIKENDNFFDFSSWNEDSIEDFAGIAAAITKNINITEWPKLRLEQTNVNTTEVSEGGNSMRRRLIQLDKWEEEEKKMVSEMKSFYEEMNGKRNLQKSPLGSIRAEQDKSASLPQKERKRLLQNFPPFSTNCTDPDDTSPPCPSEDLPKLCDKYNGGDLESCFQACKISICCTHDSKSKFVSPSCADAPNCRNWTPCYIAWWKLVDTIGPATFLRLPQNDDFFNLERNYVREEINDIRNAPFYDHFFNHFLDTDDVYDDMFIQERSNWDLPFL